MNDRFKFRVWDDVNNKYVDKGILLRCVELAIPTMKNDYDMNPVDDRYFIEQCTGIKDKNGKLIYEGDIVIKDGFKYQVVWFNTSLLGFYLADDIVVTNINDEIEVIGNIHENPELMEEQR